MNGRIVGRLCLLLLLCCGQTTPLGQLSVRQHEVEVAEEIVISVGKLNGKPNLMNMLSKVIEETYKYFSAYIAYQTNSLVVLLSRGKTLMHVNNLIHY
jgi:hypothetical protein